MSRRFGLVAALALLALAPSIAQARGYGRSGRRGGYVITPYGRMNTRSPQYRMAGGNPFVYQQLMQQQMMLKQQQMMLRQHQQSMRQMQRQKGAKQATAPSTESPISNVTSLGNRKKRKTLTPKTEAAKPASEAAAEADKGKTPGTSEEDDGQP